MTSSDTPKTEHVVIFESELQLIAANAVAWGNVETGGGLYGLRTHSGTPVVYLGTPPGPRAVHDAVFFQQDLDWFQKCNTRMLKDFGIQFQGQWHSHHSLGLTRPSSRDLESIVSIMRKNALQDFVQLIVTHNARDLADRENLRGSSRQRKWRTALSLCPGSRHIGDNPHLQVRINAFVFRPSSTPELVEVPLRVLPGMGPFRLAARSSAGTAALVRFPEALLSGENMTYDSVNVRTGVSSLPVQLEQQLLELPEEVLPRCAIR